MIKEIMTLSDIMLPFHNSLLLYTQMPTNAAMRLPTMIVIFPP